MKVRKRCPGRGEWENFCGMENAATELTRGIKGEDQSLEETGRKKKRKDLIRLDVKLGVVRMKDNEESSERKSKKRKIEEGKRCLYQSRTPGFFR